jgi:hypothetical protein
VHLHSPLAGIFPWIVLAHAAGRASLHRAVSTSLRPPNEMIRNKLPILGLGELISVNADAHPLISINQF